MDMKTLMSRLTSLEEAVDNPYQGADAEKFAAMSPEDQEWLTRPVPNSDGTSRPGKPDINDPYILARAPNKGRAVRKPDPVVVDPPKPPPPKPPDVVVDPPKPPPPKPPPKPPSPGKNEVDPKDLARFQELVSKFKLVINKKPKSIAEALMRDMGYGDEQINEWELFKPDSWFNNREYGDGTSRDDVRQQDAVKNIQGGVGSALVQNRTPLAPGSVASEEGSDGNTYAVNDKGLRTHRLDPGTQKWIEMSTSTPSENPELQPATVTDDPKPPPPKPPDPQPKPPDPQPKPPSPGKNEVDPKDLARFQELITKFKSVKPSDPKPQPPKPEPPNPQPAEEKKWPVTPDEIKAFQSSQEDPRQPGAKLKVDGMIGTHTYQALINAGYKPPADFNVTAYKPTGGGTAPKPKPKPEVQPTPPKRDWYDPRGWIGKESMSEDDQILSMIKGIKVK